MLQSPVLLGGVSTNPPPIGGDEFGNFSGGYMSFGSPLIFALPSRRTVFIQNVWLADAVVFMVFVTSGRPAFSVLSGQSLQPV